MKDLSTVTRKGQVTIPADIRRALGINEGDKVEFELLQDGHARLKRIGSVVEATRGVVRWTGPVLSAEEMRDVAEQVIAEDVARRAGLSL